MRRLAWRTGIATGEVVAGDGAAGQRMVTGDAVNVAARLQQAAQPGEILITGQTQGLVRDAVQVEPLGDISVKGRQATIEAFRLLAVDQSAAGHERRLDAPMIGRERQRRSLDDAFAEVRDQRVCHLFTILGAAGVGKSRLVNEFADALGDQARVVRGRCLSYGEGITYWPVAEIVRDATGLGTNSETDAGGDVAAIEAVLGDHPDRERIATLIGQVIGVTTGEPSPEENPWAIRTFLEVLASDRPLVVVLDDLQWAQPLMLDLVEHIADWSQNAPILLIAMARPELLEVRPAWGGGKRFATMITLDPLSADETGQLVEQLLGRADLPATMFDRVRAAAEGNPLFVEEMLAKLIDDGALAREEGGWTVSGDLSELSVPATIQALLAARLDGLGSTERGVLERGSVEGTFFHRDAVAELSPETQREHGWLVADDAHPARVRRARARGAGGPRGVPIPPPADPRRGLPGHRQAQPGRAARALRRLAGGRCWATGPMSTGRSSATTWNRRSATGESSIRRIHSCRTWSAERRSPSARQARRPSCRLTARRR